MNLPPWRRSRRRERERFARAVDEGVTYADDQEFAPELTVVSTLRGVGSASAPDSTTRGRIAGEITRGLSGRSSAPVTARPAAPSPSRRASVRPRFRVRFRTVISAVVLAVIALGGLSLLLSKDALPGDTLYDVKRAREQVSLALTFDEHDSAVKHLELATDRLDELSLLRAHNADPADYRKALTEFDRQARAGASQLTAVATTTDGQGLSDLRAWATQQTNRLDGHEASMPAANAVRPDATLLLAAIDDRAAALTDRMGCYQITSGVSDSLGALPAAGECAAASNDELSGHDGRPPGALDPEPSPSAPAPGPESEAPPARQATVDVETPPQEALPATSEPTPRFRASAPIPDDQQPVHPVPEIVRPPRMPDAAPPPPAAMVVPGMLPGLPELRLG